MGNKQSSQGHNDGIQSSERPNAASVSHSNMYRRDTKTPWTEDQLLEYQHELASRLRELKQQQQQQQRQQSSGCNPFNCCLKGSATNKHMTGESEAITVTTESHLDDVGNGNAVGPVVHAIDMGGTSVAGGRASESFNDDRLGMFLKMDSREPTNDAKHNDNNALNSAVARNADAFLELLQLDTLSLHLQEMRDRRMFLEKAANDEELPEEERQIAAWITDTYLSRSPTTNFTAQTILENIKRTATKLEHDRDLDHPLSVRTESERVEREHSEDANIEKSAIIEIIDSVDSSLRSNRVVQLLCSVDSWNFSVFDFVDLCGNSSLALLMGTICKMQDICGELAINRTHLTNYMNAVDKNYLNNPYHNHIHAADVLLNMHYFMKSALFSRAINTLDGFAILISAAVHDVGHPGNTNGFEIARESELAVRYNDQSVLENMHIALAWRLLKGQHCDILASFSKEDRKRFRKVLIDSVLATDMSQHSMHSETLEQLVEEYKDIELGDADQLLREVAARETSQNGKFADQFLPIALHTADLGNLCKQISFYTQWVDRLMNEFFAQGDKERALGIPISFLCDRVKVNIHSGQVGFINFVIRPWFVKFGRLLREDSHNTLFLELLNENLEYMQERAEKTKEAQKIIEDQEKELEHEQESEADAEAVNGGGQDQDGQGALHGDGDVELTEVDDEMKEEMQDTVPPLSTTASGQPIIYSIDDAQAQQRQSKSYSIINISALQMKSKLEEYRRND